MGNLQHDDLAPLADAVREAYLSPPDEATQARHLAAMAQATRVTQHEEIPARPKARRLKGDLVTRFRTAAPLVKLAALTIVGAFATAGLATAGGVIDLPDSLPGSSSDRANAVHDAIDGVDASETHPGTLIDPAEGAGASTEDHGKSAEAQENGADPEEGAGQAFGDSVSDRATGGEPKDDGGAFGDSVSEEAKNLVDTPEPQGSQETGETNAQGAPETGETHSQQGQDTATTHGGGKPQD
jgi:hypothetical protein